MSQKEELVCYCMGYSREEIRLDALTHGRSTIVERIKAVCRAGFCNCAASNPRGGCCLADVRQVADEVLGEGIKI